VGRRAIEAAASDHDFGAGEAGIGGQFAHQRFGVNAVPAHVDGDRRQRPIARRFLRSWRFQNWLWLGLRRRRRKLRACGGGEDRFFLEFWRVEGCIFLNRFESELGLGLRRRRFGDEDGFFFFTFGEAENVIGRRWRKRKFLRLFVDDIAGSQLKRRREADDIIVRGVCGSRALARTGFGSLGGSSIMQDEKLAVVSIAPV